MAVGADAVADFHRLASTPKPKTKSQHEQPGERMGFKTMELVLNPIYFNPLKLAAWFSGSKSTSSLVYCEHNYEAYVSSLMAVLLQQKSTSCSLGRLFPQRLYHNRFAMLCGFLRFQKL